MAKLIKIKILKIRSALSHNTELKSSATSIKYKVEGDERYLPYRVRSLALQPLSAGNSAEFSQVNNSKTIPREIHLTSLDSLGSCESIYVYFKPKKSVEM